MRLLAFISVAILFVVSSPTLNAEVEHLSTPSLCQGKIYRVADKSVIDITELGAAIAEAKVVVFGERHSSIEHSVASGCVLHQLAQASPKISVIMQVISSSYSEKIAEFRRSGSLDAAGLGVYLEWWVSGWPSFINWVPLISEAFNDGLAIYGGDLPLNDNKTRKISPGELAELQAKLGPKFDSILSGWQKSLTEAHCGLISQKEAQKLAEHQIRRDVWTTSVANQLLETGEKVYLHVNRGHARRDRSLVGALEQITDKKIISVGAVWKDEEIIARSWKAFDYIFVTGDAKRPDVCSVLKSSTR